MELNQTDKIVLQELAKEYSELASLPIQQKKRELWQALNRGKMQRPMVNLDQLPWHELDVDGSLINKITDPYWSGVETSLRQTIYKANHMPADSIVEPYILLPRCINNSGFGVSVEEEVSVGDSKNGVVGHKYFNQFESMEDVEKISTPTITLDSEKETLIKQQAELLFQGIAPIKMLGETLHLGIWDKITLLMGVENCYFALLDEPELIHAIMERFTNVYISMIEQMNKLKLFDTYSNLCHCSYTYSDDLPNKDNATSKDSWAFGLAQLFSSVSPEITAEFEVPYMQRLFPYFGAIYYGCCDRLDDRMDIITKMPNIRKISCSPWSLREEFAQRIPKNIIMSNKPNPALIAGDIVDYDDVRADLRRTIKAARDNSVGLELILKDISTVKYQPQRVWEWSRIALEEVQNY